MCLGFSVIALSLLLVVISSRSSGGSSSSSVLRLTISIDKCVIVVLTLRLSIIVWSSSPGH